MVHNEPFLNVLCANPILVAETFFDVQYGTFKLFICSCKIVAFLNYILLLD